MADTSTRDLFEPSKTAVKRDKAIQQVVDRADELDPNWSERAYGALTLYCRFFRTVEFIAEDARGWAESRGLISAPHDSRAWGAVMKRAAKNMLIRKVGYAPAKSSNLSPKVQWVPV